MCYDLVQMSHDFTWPKSHAPLKLDRPVTFRETLIFSNEFR